MVKITQEKKAKIKQEQEVSFVKLQCAYPLKKCPVYLCYRVNGGTSGKTVVFAAQLTHIHPLGQVKIANRTKNNQGQKNGASEGASAKVDPKKQRANLLTKDIDGSTEQERIKREALLKNITE